MEAVVSWWFGVSLLIMVLVAIKPPDRFDPLKGFGKFICVNAFVSMAAFFFIKWLFS